MIVMHMLIGVLSRGGNVKRMSFNYAEILKQNPYDMLNVDYRNPRGALASTRILARDIELALLHASGSRP